MKKLLTVVLLTLVIEATSQTKPVKIVFDVTSADSLTHQAVLRHVSLMATAYPQSSFEVVVYGSAMPMFVKGKSTVAAAIQKLEAITKVSFKVCEQTIARYKVGTSLSIPNLATVP